MPCVNGLAGIRSFPKSLTTSFMTTTKTNKQTNYYTTAYAKNLNGMLQNLLEISSKICLGCVKPERLSTAKLLKFSYTRINLAPHILLL